MVSSKETTPAALRGDDELEHAVVRNSARRYPDTYNEQPLKYMALAAQKNNYSAST